MKADQKMCSRCIFDESIPGIVFDSNGVCNYCKKYDEIARVGLFTGEGGKSKLEEIVRKIRKDGRKKEFDCLIGLSGGVDSSYVAYLTKKLGLRPLAVHLDNGWNSEPAERNIENIVRKLDIELYRYTADWEEFKDIQISFLKAGVIDIEMVTDHAIKALMMKVARKNKLKYFIGGSNIVTEAVMPEGWSYAKWDFKNIKAIQKRFGHEKISTLPHYNMFHKIFYDFFLGTIHILNYVDYNKENAMQVLQDELAWEYYGGKHYESIFTRFYQTYILPHKFAVDKRKGHFSTLICSGQMTRPQALEEIKKPICDPSVVQQDRKYVVSKLGLTEGEFDAMMNEPPRSHLDYPNGQIINSVLKKVKMRLIKRRD